MQSFGLFASVFEVTVSEVRMQKTVAAQNKPSVRRHLSREVEHRTIVPLHLETPGAFWLA